MKIGDIVYVGNPRHDDIHNHAFEGTVAKIQGEYVTVIDQDDEAFEIELEQLFLDLQGG
jgi:hypothetical protein